MSSELGSLPSIADLPKLSGPDPMPQVRYSAKPHLHTCSSASTTIASHSTVSVIQTGGHLSVGFPWQ